MATLPVYPTLPFQGALAGQQTPFGTLLSPGVNAIFLRSTGAQTGDHPSVVNNLVTTLSKALSYCRSGMGDVIYVLPGHTENVTDALMLTNLVAGTKIIGVGHGSNRPTFRWTATTSSWPISVADVIISGLRLRLEGANGVTKAINVTGSDFLLQDCDIETASGASNGAVIGIELGTGADRATLANLRVRGKTYTGAANVVKITGTAQNGIRILNSSFIAPGHTTTGLIQVNCASTDLYFDRLRLYNTIAASTCTICLDDFASDGFFVDVHSADKNNGTATAQGITFGSSTLVQCSWTYEVDEVKKNSILSPAVGT